MVRITMPYQVKSMATLGLRWILARNACLLRQYIMVSADIVTHVLLDRFIVMASELLTNSCIECQLNKDK
ncbi:hypothetical protein GJ496_006040 [Pomphorhynchus laevis]|nr:hypothetical protein GJ496_006040 [Pomphorhynchus laevis]